MNCSSVNSWTNRLRSDSTGGRISSRGVNTPEILDDAPRIVPRLLGVDGRGRRGILVAVVHFVSDDDFDGRERDAIRARLEIVDGLLWALDNFDAISGVVAQAKDSDEALRNLTCDPFRLSKVQAHHILDMSLRRRTKLSRRELSSERDHLTALL
jgi:hypothetical protein